MNKIVVIHIFLLLAMLLPLLGEGGRGTVSDAPTGDVFNTPELREWAAGQIDGLMTIQDRNSDMVMNTPDVIGWGISFDLVTGSMIFEIMYDSTKPVPPLGPEIEGVPVQMTPSTWPVRSHGGMDCTSGNPCHANQLPLPVQMGNSSYPFEENYTPWCSSCTLGFKVCMLSTLQKAYVTNAHCATDQAGCGGMASIGIFGKHRSPGDTEPPCEDTSIVGTLSGYAPFPCTGTTEMDAAKFLSVDSQTQVSIRDVGTPAWEGISVLPHDIVQKSGRSTGLRQGRVGTVSYTTFSRDPFCTCKPKMVKQITIIGTTVSLPFQQEGDSGSALVKPGNPPRVAGLMWGYGYYGAPPIYNYGIASRISSVLSGLNASLNFNQECDLEGCPSNLRTGDPCTTPGDVCRCGTCKYRPPRVRMCKSDHTWSECDPCEQW